MATRSRPSGPILGAVAVCVVVAVGLGLAVHQALLGSPRAALDEAATRIEAMPGVAAVSTELEERVPSRRQLRRALVSDTDRSDGEATVTVTVAASVDAAALARILDDARAALQHDRLAEHDVSIEYVQAQTERRIFDGWSPLLPERVVTTAELESVASLALRLPEGAWLDLEPASHEQGQFDVVGPPHLGILLGDDRGDGFTIGAPVDAASGLELLVAAEQLATDAEAALGGTTAIELRTPDGMLVRTATQPAAIPAALADLIQRVTALPFPDAVHVELDTTLEWRVEPTGARGVPRMTVLLDLDVAGCSPAVDPEVLRADVERLLASHEVEHDVETIGCGGR
ncbi:MULTISPECIES: hypothetical protein [unclassified Agrococcus]|uniref:hypothetical protein n=1 Tax=unclassified Agrococcus TaxID=2615065 RepID=UPI003616672B